MPSARTKPCPTRCGRTSRRGTATLLAGIYYNLACVQSLQRKRAALGSLSAAIDHDYIRNNYTAYDWMLRDPDLSYLRGLDAFGPLKERAAAQGDYLAILRAAAPYDRTAPTDSLPRFRYAAPNNPDLVRVRTYFKASTAWPAAATKCRRFST